MSKYKHFPPYSLYGFPQSLLVNSIRGRIRGERTGNITSSLAPRDPKRFGRAE